MLLFTPQTVEVRLIPVRLFSRVIVPSVPVACAALLFTVLPLAAQQTPSVSSSSSDAPAAQQAPPQQPKSSAAVRRGDQAGSAVTLETSEALFDMAVALNECGYDNGLDSSLPVRAAIRKDVQAAVSESAPARESREALCSYIDHHKVAGAQNLAQYVSLALFLTPPPDLQLSVPEPEAPPDALQVEGVLPLLRDFAAKIQLHNLLARHHQAYDESILQVRDSLTRMLLETNVYLHLPVSTYDGRRFLVLLEPMLSPQAVNARIYGNDYFVATSPADISTQVPAKPSAGARMSVSAHAAGLQMDQVRHLYMLYTLDPIIYARAGATNRLLPILKVIQEAPLDFLYKNDIVAFTTECLIKAIEARTMDTGLPKPSQTVNGKQRTEANGYNEAVIDWEKKSEAVRRRQVLVDAESGWVLTESFYNALAVQDRDGVSIKESIGEMVYGMDVNSEVSRAKKIPFFDADSTNLVGSGGVTRGRAPKRSYSVMDQAEIKLQQGDKIGAQEMAEAELKKNPKSGEALYMMARIHLIEGEPQEAYDGFTQVIAVSKDPRSVAWSHVYLGRLYDTQQKPDRKKAVAEYQAAFSTPGAQADILAAARAGIQKPFAPPKRTMTDSDQRQQPEDDEELDPTGKKQKESYKPSEEVTPK